MTLVLAAGNGKALWYLTRATGVVSLLLLTAVLLLGIASSIRWRSDRWPRFVVADLHRNLTLLSIAFVAVHVVTSIADGFAPIRLLDAIVPFASPYRTLWLGLGTVGFDLLLALVATSLLRARVGYRVWRLVHWLAYAAWPVALLHSLGAGSDGRFGWFAFVALACLASVVLALAVRLLQSAETAGLRVAIGTGTLVIALLVLGWYRGGPLQPGWAAKAGTPVSLLHAAKQRVAVARTTTTTAPATFSEPFTGQLDARLARSSDQSGDVGVAIAGNVRGAHIAGILQLDLWGTASGEEGVSMTTSRVTFSPVGAQPYSGAVSALDGDRLVADLTNGSGRSLRLTVVLNIDAENSTVSGAVHGASA